MRLLSPSERAVWLLDQASALNGILIAHFAGEVAPETIRAGLDRLQARHPLLRAAIEGLPKTRYVEGGAPIPLSVVARESDASWRALAEEELNRRFLPTDRCLMRAVLLRGDERSDLLLCLHHVVSDARSAVRLLKEILDGDSRPPLPLRPAMVELLPKSVQGVTRVLRLNNFFWRQAGHALFVRSRRLPLDARPAPSERRTRMLRHALSAGETAALTARCRAEKTSVHAVLVAAILQAASADLGEAGATLGCFSAVDLRAQLEPPVAEDEIGLFVSQATTYHRMQPDRPIFDLAREVRAQLAKRMARGEPLVTLPLLGLFVPGGDDRDKIVHRFAARADQATPAAVGVTNIGRLDLEARYGPITIEGVHFAIGLGPVVPAALTACALAGALQWNLLYVEPLLSAGRAEALAAQVASSLRAALA
jgi:hypothetical protein